MVAANDSEWLAPRRNSLRVIFFFFFLPFLFLVKKYSGMVDTAVEINGLRSEIFIRARLVIFFFFRSKYS